MSFVACGLNHKTAPIELREQFYFSAETLDAALLDLTQQTQIREAVILSTCNRTEIYCRTQKSPAVIANWLSQYHQVEPKNLNPYLYLHEGEETVKHAFRVASGMDSLLLGEPQIFGQLKKAVSHAHHLGTLGNSLRVFFDQAFQVGKHIRTKTQIGTNSDSLGKIILQFSRQVFESIAEKRVLLVGAGKAIEFVGDYLKKNGLSNIFIANRTELHAKKLSEKIGVSHYGSLACLVQEIKQADIIITATSSDKIVISPDMVSSIQKPVLFFDLSLPRNIDPLIKHQENIYLYSIDELKNTQEENRHKKKGALKTAEIIVHHEAKEFIGKLRSLKIAHTVKKYREKMNVIRDSCLEKALESLISGEHPEQVLKKLASQLTNKFMHDPTVNLKKAACQDAWVMVHAAEHLLGIDA